jgi:predicted transposase YdaD
VLVIDHDRLFKELLTTFFVEFLDLFFPEVLRYLDISRLEFLDKELFTDVTSGDTYEADIVVKAAFHEQPAFFIIHVEHQAQAEEAFDLRMFRYVALEHFKHGVPIYPIALFSDDSARRVEPDTYQMAFPDLEVLQFRYRVIQLRRLPWHDFATRRNPVASALLPKMGMERSERPTVLLTSLRLLAQLGLDAARRRLISGFINTYLRLNDQEQAQFEHELAQLAPDEQEATMELTSTWKEEGIQEGIKIGRKEGEQDGKQEEARNLTVRLLTRRFGPMDPELQQRINKLSLPQLEQLFDAIYDFTSSDDLRIWFDTNPPDEPEANTTDGRIYQLGGHAMTSPDPGSDTKTMTREFGVRTPSKFSFPQEAEQINGVA